MLAKLTLTVDKTLIAKSKKMAQKRNKSLSRIVSDYLTHLLDAEKTQMSMTLNSPITDSITGMFTDNGKDYKTLLEEAIVEKNV